jgi:hypothetical protein
MLTQTDDKLAGYKNYKAHIVDRQAGIRLKRNKKRDSAAAESLLNYYLKVSEI